MRGEVEWGVCEGLLAQGGLVMLLQVYCVMMLVEEQLLSEPVVLLCLGGQWMLLLVCSCYLRNFFQVLLSQ